MKLFSSSRRRELEIRREERAAIARGGSERERGGEGEREREREKREREREREERERERYGARMTRLMRILFHAALVALACVLYVALAPGSGPREEENQGAVLFYNCHFWTGTGKVSEIKREEVTSSSFLPSLVNEDLREQDRGLPLSCLVNCFEDFNVFTRVKNNLCFLQTKTTRHIYFRRMEYPPPTLCWRIG